MQASSIKIGNEYAIIYQGAMRSMYVDAIKTVRTKSGATNYAEGRLTKDSGEIQSDETGNEPIRVSYKVEDVLGPFAEQAALVATRTAAKAAKQALDQARVEAADLLVQKLYVATGMVAPNEKFNALFDHPYNSGRVELSAEGVAKLLDLLDLRGL